MKIKILKGNTLTRCRWSEGQINIGCDKDLHCCDHDPAYAWMCDTRSDSFSCVTSQVDEGQKFYCNLIPEGKKSIISTCYLEKGALKGYDRDKFSTLPEDTSVLLVPNIPTSPNVSDFYGDGMIFTSDGVLQLEEGDFITCVKGEITKVNRNEVLEMLSKGKEVSQSPSYKKVRVSPVTTRPKKPKPSVGTVIFNKNTGNLEVFTKDGWKGLKYADSQGDD